ncbi:hypothetical protein RRG08_043092 [Elysia crispata]|uniref:Uncharacterized protein n=1 Tax=Elysia crispata TaxID=231223 RepID=A0AAE0XZK7_9GAST|nr:hypothetical protein RRG08_043092 [Elysia crispata]
MKTSILTRSSGDSENVNPYMISRWLGERQSLEDLQVTSGSSILTKSTGDVTNVHHYVNLYKNFKPSTTHNSSAEGCLCGTAV